jgi:hypothetical protein
MCFHPHFVYFFWGGERFSAVWGLEIFEIVAISFLPRRTRWQNFWPTGTHSMQEARLNRISVYRRSIFAYRTAHVARVIHDMSRAFCQKRKKNAHLWRISSFVAHWAAVV